MTPEHKALVAELRRRAERRAQTEGPFTKENLVEWRAASAIESLSAQGAQPQAVEAVGYVTPDSIAEVAAGRIGNHLFPKGTLRPENEIPVYASPQPANPAQVTDAMVEAASAKYREIGARCNWQHSWPSEEAFHEIITAAIGAGGQAVASPVSGDYFIQERDDDMLICAKLWQYGSTCIARRPKLATNDEWRSTAQDIVNALSALSQPHLADERVVEARLEMRGPETEAILKRDGYFLVLDWWRLGKHLTARVYEPQMMPISDALADLLALALEDRPELVGPALSAKEGR